MITSKRILSLAMIAGMAMAAPAFAQATKDKQPTTPPAPATPAKPTTPATPATPAKQPDAKGGDTMAEWTKAATLSPEHIEMNKNMVGEWDTKSSFWMAPNTQPMVSEGHAKFDSTMGGRFVTQDYTGKLSMPGADGKTTEIPFKGHGVYAYNNVTKEYENIWYDSTATGIMLSTGKKEANGDLVFTGTYDDAMSGQKKTAKSVIHHDGKDKMTYTMFDKNTDGTEFKNLEVVYTRSTPARMGEPAGEKKTDEKKDKTPGN
jgi:hypothetical protein